MALVLPRPYHLNEMQFLRNASTRGRPRGGDGKRKNWISVGLWRINVEVPPVILILDLAKQHDIDVKFPLRIKVKSI